MRILIVSDIHANLNALNSVLSDAGHFDRIWCLGDIVGYGPDPNGCIETLRQYDLLCVAGNHDWAVLEKLDIDEFNSDARQAALWTRNQLTVNNLEWLDALPEELPAQFGTYTIVHGSPRYPIWEYVLTPAIAFSNFDHFDTPVCFMGHTHVPVVFRHLVSERLIVAEPLVEGQALILGSERVMINPGSVGQPRDGDPRAAYALLDTETATFFPFRVEYDIAATQEQMERAGLPPRLISRLSQGW